MQSFAYDTDELELVWDAASINEAKKKNRDALFMDISLVNNMPKFKIIDHGYNYSKSQFMLQEEGFTLPQGNFRFSTGKNRRSQKYIYRETEGKLEKI